MHRVLTVTALGLIVTGLELSTEIVSTVAARLSAGARALVQGSEGFVPTGLYVAGVGFLVMGLGMLGAAMWARRMRRKVDVAGTACPRCGTETRRVRRRTLERFLGAVLGEQVTRRRCGKCAWSGLSLRQGA